MQATLSEARLTDEHAIKVSEWIKNPKNFLVFVGEPGIGKTYLCAAILDYMYDKVSTVRVYQERDFLERIRKSIAAGGDFITEVHSMIDDELIIFDDLGSSGTPNEWRKEVLFEFLDKRYSTMLPTIITTNLNTQQINENYHPRFCSRLFASENTIINMEGYPDLRLVL